MNGRPSRRRDESGVVAVVITLLAIALFACGAVVIDLGNAYTRARSQQTRADFAALSAGDLLPAKTPAEQLAVADRIAEYIHDFHLQDDRGAAAPSYTGQDLLDSGAVTFPKPNRVVFDAPDVRVDFGLGRLLGLDSIDVTREATVDVRSLSGKVVAPLYAVTGCDYGAQVLKDQPNGLTPSTIPSLDLTSSADKNNKISMAATGAVTPSSVTEDPVSLPVLTLAGDFNGDNDAHPSLITGVGFFRDNTGPTPDFHYVAAPFDVTATGAKVTVPAQVVADSGIWFVRVREAGKWSDATTAAVLTVGAAATPTCPAGSAGGNFGQLSFGDLSNPNDDIAHIFKDGPDHNIVAFDGSPTPGECTHDPAPIVRYENDNEDANCVFTETGFKPNAATDGLLKNGGRLDADTTPRCGSARTTVDSTWSVNNDYLSCFFTDPTTTIATIANSSYTGPAVISADIVKSPRFFFVPVFSEEPATGTKAYKITGFRPAFLTEQDNTATRSDGPINGNGITVGSNHKVAALKFVLFDEDALPDTLDAGPPAAPTYSYGPKIVMLVN